MIKIKKIILISLSILMFLGLFNKTYAAVKYFYTDILTLDSYNATNKTGFFSFTDESSCTTSWQKKVDDIYTTTNYDNIRLQAKITLCFSSETIPTKAEFQAKFKDYAYFESSVPFYYFSYLKTGSVSGFKTRVVSIGYKSKEFCLNGKNQTLIPSYELYEDCAPYKKPPINNNDLFFESLNPDDPTNVPAVSIPGYNEEYNLLAPLPGLEKVTNDQGISDYFNIIFKIIIGICGVLAVVMIVVGGIQYMLEESVFSKAEAKNRIISAIGGLILALGAWALLNTINPDLLGKGGLKIKDVKITLEADDDTPHNSDSNGMYCNGKGKTGYKTGSVWPPSGIKSGNTIRAELKSKGITVEGVECTKVGQGPGCVSVAGLNTSKVLKIKQNCPSCEIVITEGTACWKHTKSTNHRPGGDVVDLKYTNSLKNYVESGEKKEPAWPSINYPKNIGFKKDGLEFVKEIGDGTWFHFGSN